MNLVMIPFHDWRKCAREGFRTRDAHWMEEFGRHPAVDKLLIVNRPLSLIEMTLFRRSRITPGGQIVARNGNAVVSQMSEKTFVLDIFVPELLRPIRLRRNWIPRVMEADGVSAAARWAMDRLDIADNEWSFLISQPIFVPLLQRNRDWPFSLDADDNLLKHPQYRSTPRLREYYDYCLANADAVFTNSVENRDFFRNQRKDAIWISNGVNTDHFATGETRPLPADMIEMRRPIVGYTGHMQEMVDVEATISVMRAFPDASFVFVGRQLNSAWLKALWREPNCYYLGDKHYREMPSYLSAFNVCFIPYSRERQHGGDPIKFYEYLAMGKPVVTTNIGGVSRFADYPQVRITETVAEFVEPLREFLGEIAAGRRLPTKPLPAECEWRTKADTMLQIISDRLKARRAAKEVA